MKQATFRDALATLLHRFLEEGGDAWWLTRELGQQGAEVMEELRCDLVEYDQAEEPPY